MLSFCLLLLPLSASSLPLLGWVESPGYPRGYPEDSSLKWMRCAPPGHALSLTLTHLDLEDSEDCANDALQISVDNQTVYNLCGHMSYEEIQSSVNPSLLSSVSGCLSLSFKSDYSNSERHNGFRAFYTVQDVDECAHEDNGCSQFCSNYIGGYRCSCRPGYSLQNDGRTCTAMCSEDLSGSLQGMVSSPGWPGPYAADAQCSYTLLVEGGLQLVLEFMGEFDVEEQKNGVCVDYLLIKTTNKVFGPFCGKDPPASPILTGSHQVQIVFSSDNSGSNTGFRIVYTTTEKTCPTQVTPNSYMTPKLPRYQTNQRVTVQCNTGFLHNQDGQHAINNATYTSWCGRTGTWSPVYSCEVVECSEPDLQADQWPLGVLNMTTTQYQGAIHLQCSSKYYNLVGEERYICDHLGEWRSEAGHTELPKCVPVCGRTEKDLISIGRIIGGKRADPEQIPWQLRLISHQAGASLINDQWAVTAAHVFDERKENPRILAGGIDLRKTKRETLVNLTVEKYYIHPKYQPQVKVNFDNDIALLKLNPRAPLSSSLLPICLPEKAEVAAMDGQWGTISGWGAIKNSEKKQSPDLLYAHVQIYSSEKCSKTPTHKDKDVPLVFTENMFCAGDAGKDSCQGDSGGPLVLPQLGSDDHDNRKPYQLYGIVSWGAECGNLGYYTKVNKYLDWIKETMEKEPSSG